MKRKFISISLISLFIVLTSTSHILAQDSVSIGFAQKDEAKYINLEPGETFSNKFTVWNIFADTTTYYVYISGFQQVEDYPGTSIPLSPEDDIKDPYSASSWINTEIKEIDLEPNKNVDIYFTITVPQDVALGEYHGKIFLSTMNPEDIDTDEENTAAYSNLSTGPDFLIQIGDKDKLIEDMDLLRFTSDKRFYEYPKATFLTKIENTGNTHVAIAGDIVIYNILNKEVGRFSVNPNKASTLRGETAQYRTEWSSSRQILNTENQLIVGPMRAELVATYKSENPGFYPILSETKFWIIPWKLILAIIVAIILISMGLKVRKRSSKKKTDA